MNIPSHTNMRVCFNSQLHKFSLIKIRRHVSSGRVSTSGK